jgi:uncharacterized membrane protein
VAQTGLTAVLWFLALGSGLIGGVFFAFSAFIMRAFSRLPAGQGAAAMNAIDSTILKSLFMPIFSGTALVSLALGAVSLFRLGQNGAILVVAACALYFTGMFVVTMVCNVPLNNALAAANPASAADVWARYLKNWTFWNHVRTVASLVACGLFIAALRAHGVGAR